MTCNNWHAVLCPYKVCYVCLFRCISQTQYCFDKYQSFFFNFSSVLVWLLSQDILKAIWQSWHQCYIIKVIINTASAMAWAYKNFIFLLQIFFGQNSASVSDAPLYSFFWFSYLVSISLWYNYSFLYNFLPIHWKASIGVRDKWMFEFLEAPIHYCFGKISHLEYFLPVLSKTFMLEFFF